MDQSEQRCHARIHGLVQGVGYRYYIHRQASSLGLRGYVRNLADGDVEVVAEGSRDALDRLLEALERGPSGAEVDHVDLDWRPAQGDLAGFSIRM